MGLGLMGGSLARAVKEAGLPWRVRGMARDPQTRRAALAAGAVDEAVDDPAAAAAAADIVVLALPLLAVPGAARALAPHVSPGTVVTDVGSTKA
ncbi:MAG TPA: prephenate dehydrogenase/arogenate dehydrogenase family protein, partial [Candidatus Methanoperedens sp.]|nr:prephenate dehydrogenase/arogenate dehydrogenase family protein [Candidatus Methanoperedens sp.]